jgi:sugar phosphate isomerase/epimerase
MKIGLVVSTEDAPPSAYVVFRDDLGKCVDRCAALGYDGVELALRKRSQADVNMIKQRLAATGLEVSCISTGQVFAVDRLYFTHPDMVIRKEAVERIAAMIRLAAEFGAMVNMGRVRGVVHEDEDRLQALQWFTDCVHQCADIAEPLGVQLLIEPVNRYEVNFINNCAEGLEIVRALARTCLRLMPDTFHMNIEDISFRDSLLASKEHIGYIHVADSNRRAPGWGHLPFNEVFAALHEIHYDGWITSEVLPFPDPGQAAKQAIRFLRPYASHNNAAAMSVQDAQSE